MSIDTAQTIAAATAKAGSLERLANEMGVPASSVASWGAGDTAPPPESQQWIENYLGGRPLRLNPCPDCTMQVSPRAENCPHCGYVFRSLTSSVFWGVLVANLVLGSIGVVLWWIAIDSALR